MSVVVGDLRARLNSWKKASSYPPATTNSSRSSKDASVPPRSAPPSRSTGSWSSSIGRSAGTSQPAFATEGWGSKINDRLARDLQAEFPGVEGFSPGTSGTCVLWPRPGRRTNFAIAHCQIALGPQCEGSGPDQGSSHPRVVPAGSARIRLESGCPGSSDQEPLAREGREGTHQLPA